MRVIPAKRSAKRGSSGKLRQISREPAFACDGYCRQQPPALMLSQTAHRAIMPIFRQKLPCVYILASRKEGTLYTGVTSDLVGRLHSHKQGDIPGFTKRYGVDRLVYFELHPTMGLAITREKQIKKWYRAWKIELIESTNPAWRDLSPEVFNGSAFEQLSR